MTSAKFSDFWTPQCHVQKSRNLPSSPHTLRTSHMHLLPNLTSHHQHLCCVSGSNGGGNFPLSGNTFPPSFKMRIGGRSKHSSLPSFLPGLPHYGDGRMTSCGPEPPNECDLEPLLSPSKECIKEGFPKVA